MKKNLLLLLIMAAFSWQGYGQILNQNAGWPNAGWTLGGSYNAGSLVVV